MAKYLKLDIPSPCSQNWNEMIPDKQGRFCSSCQKTVTDFTQMSDAQLLQFFKKNKEAGCGRFREDQLRTEILIPGKTIPFVKFLFQIAIPVFLFSPKANAQRTVGRVKMETRQVDCKVGESVLPKNDSVPVKPTVVKALPVTGSGYLMGDTLISEDFISGKVIDGSGNPIPFATITIKGTDNSTSSDERGKFIIRKVSFPVNLVGSSSGFIGQEMKIETSKESRDIVFSLIGAVSGGFVGVIVGMAEPKRKEKIEVKKDTSSFIIYPNPVNVGSVIQIQNQNLKAGEYKAFVYSLDGKLMQTSELVLPKKGQVCSLSIQWLVSGNYVIQLVNKKSGKAASAQVMVTQ